MSRIVAESKPSLRKSSSAESRILRAVSSALGVAFAGSIDLNVFNLSIGQQAPFCQALFCTRSETLVPKRLIVGETRKLEAISLRSRWPQADAWGYVLWVYLFGVTPKRAPISGQERRVLRRQFG